jgi:hypothetical protein
MGRMYSASFAIASVGVGVSLDFVEIVAPATAVVVIHEIHITQDTLEASEQLPAAILRVPATATSGSGGASVTPRKIGGVLDAAAASTVESGNTTVATTSGTLETIRRMAENILNGWHWVFTPETRIVVPPSGMVVVRLVTGPTATMSMSGELIFEEIG